MQNVKNQKEIINTNDDLFDLEIEKLVDDYESGNFVYYLDELFKQLNQIIFPDDERLHNFLLEN